MTAFILVVAALEAINVLHRSWRLSHDTYPRHERQTAVEEVGCLLADAAFVAWAVVLLAGGAS